MGKYLRGHGPGGCGQYVTQMLLFSFSGQMRLDRVNRKGGKVEEETSNMQIPFPCSRVHESKNRFTSADCTYGLRLHLQTAGSVA